MRSLNGRRKERMNGMKNMRDGKEKDKRKKNLERGEEKII